MATDKPQPSPQKILVAGGSGFIGSRLIKKLAADIHYHQPQSRDEILSLTRDPESIKDMFDEDVRLVKADVSNYEDVAREAFSYITKWEFRSEDKPLIANHHSSN